MSQIENICSAMAGRVSEMLKMWNLPGVSVVLVQDGKTVFCDAYGSRDLAADLPMTVKTHLPIGSVTKSFTALALGMLADEGKLDWDKPVIEYIPWLKLVDSTAQQNATARDQMCHRTGLAKYDAHAVFCTKDDRKAMVEDLQYLQPAAPLPLGSAVLQPDGHAGRLSGGGPQRHELGEVCSDPHSE